MKARILCRKKKYVNYPGVSQHTLLSNLILHHFWSKCIPSSGIISGSCYCEGDEHQVLCTCMHICITMKKCDTKMCFSAVENTTHRMTLTIHIDSTETKEIMTDLDQCM